MTSQHSLPARPAIAAAFAVRGNGRVRVEGCTVVDNVCVGGCTGANLAPVNLVVTTASSIAVVNNILGCELADPAGCLAVPNSDFTALGQFAGNFLNSSASALLGPLQDNGGPTPTRLPQPTSPVANAGDATFTTETTDQRGESRVVDGGVDAGAVELKGTELPNRLPAGVAAATSVTLDEDTTANGDVLAGVTDVNGDALNATLLSNVAFGSFSLQPSGAWTFMPGTDANGNTSFTFRVSDARGGDVDGTVNLSVRALHCSGCCGGCVAHALPVFAAR